MKTVKGSCHQKWIMELGAVTEEDWLFSCNSFLHKLKEVKLRDFQFKINNKIFLHKIYKVGADKCFFCKE